MESLSLKAKGQIRYHRFFNRLRKAVHKTTGTAPFYPFEGSDARFQIQGLLKDASVFGAISCSGTFEPHVMKLIQSLVKRDDIVLDVGANIGALTCAFSKLAANGKVYAFEASSTALGFLRKNIAGNRLDQASAMHAAVADTSGSELTMNVTDGFLGGAFLSTISIEDGRKEVVRTTTLDDWAAQHGVAKIDFIKMDIEGSELLALAGASKILKQMKPLLLIECNAIALHRFHQRSPREMFELLSEFYEYLYIVPDSIFPDAIFPGLNQVEPSVVRIESADDLLLSLRHGRGSEDLICSPRSLSQELRITHIEQHLAELKAMHGGREVILEPDWNLRLAKKHFQSTPGATFDVELTLINLSSQGWANWKDSPVHLSYHLSDEHERIVTFDGVRTALPEALPPGAEKTFRAKVVAPLARGKYRVHFSPVQEGVIWFDKVKPRPAWVELEVR